MTHIYIFLTVHEQQEFFPESLRLATIIPIPKPGKDHAEPTNYRPIALTSCLYKTLERMINKRLVWYLESNNLITKFQSGFRAERSTNDNLVRLQNSYPRCFYQTRTCSRCFSIWKKPTILLGDIKFSKTYTTLVSKEDYQTLLKFS